MILLDPLDHYVYEDGSLPIRPDWDKGFIKQMIAGQTVLCSQNVLDTIPESFKRIAWFTTDENMPYDINWGISTFKLMPNMILVTRGPATKKIPGKKFRLDGYINIFKDEKGLEIWVKFTS